MDRSARRSSIGVVAALALAGCGGPGSFQGTVDGLTLAVKDSLFLAYNPGGDQLALLVLLMTDKPGLCEAMKAGNIFSNTTYFQAALGDSLSDPSALPPPGDFIVTNGFAPPARFTFATVFRTDASCGLPASVDGHDGTVSVRQYRAQSGGSMTGTFDATFGTFEPAGHATGDFNADFCDVPSVASGCQ